VTPQSERRREIARRIVHQLAAHTDLRAALLAGSAALGTSDEHSDIDLITYYDADLPDMATFETVMRGLGAEPAGLINRPGPDGFGARYQIDGIEVQTGPSPIAGIEARLTRIEAADVDWITAKVAMGLLEGIPLYGAELVRSWQKRAVYPESMRRREVEANLEFFPIWQIDEHLAARDAELFRRQMLLDGAFRVVAVLSAINRLHFSTFQFKHAAGHLSRMSLKPDRLAERLDFVASAAPSEAAEELRGLVEETKAIVRAELPDVDVEIPRQPLRDQKS
jgi:predicted nucleotidyltransferase